mgnify:CR=1 FL=1
MLRQGNGAGPLGRLMVLPLKKLWRGAARRWERRQHAADPNGPQFWRANGALTLEQAAARDAAAHAAIARARALLPPYPRREVCPHERGDICAEPAEAIKLLVEVLLDAGDETSAANVDRIRRAVIALGGEATLAQHVDGEIWSPLDLAPAGSDVTGACRRCGGRSWFADDRNGDARCARCANSVEV